MTTLIELMCVVLLLPVSLLSAYQWVLAVISLLSSSRFREGVRSSHHLKFIVLIPAHNEESGLPSTINSLGQLHYPKELTRVVVVADRCDDATAAVARNSDVDCLERRNGQGGKGAAIAWALQEIKAAGITFDGLVIIDADALAHPHLLEAFNQGLLTGHQVQQGYNYLSNPWESPFTRIIAVTSVLRNGLFYAGREQVGLSCMLTGTGMCFSRKIIEQHGWTAFSVGEDWEFSTSLLLAGERIHFNASAMVLAKESHDLKEASRQRLRWASGRYAVITSSAWQLFVNGIQRRSVSLMEAAVTLVSPNYSSQASLATLGLMGGWVVLEDPSGGFLLTWAMVLITSLGMYFFLGVLLTEAPWRTLAGIPLIPIFLAWRLAIEVLGLLGYGRKHWARTSRPTVSGQETDH